VAVALVVLGLLAVGAGCSDDGDGGEGTGGTTTTATGAATATTGAPTDQEGAGGETSPGGGPEVAVASSRFGDILVDGDGMTLYVLVEGTCEGACLEAWPPLAAPAEPQAGEGVDAADLGTTTAADGTVQVTYRGAPLYRFAGDAIPGDATGQAFNDVWFVVGPDGEPIREAS
jgi:predicted lipoprotein with Yx(FWY)xxD motif